MVPAWRAHGHALRAPSRVVGARDDDVAEDGAGEGVNGDARRARRLCGLHLELHVPALVTMPRPRSWSYKRSAGTRIQSSANPIENAPPATSPITVKSSAANPICAGGASHASKAHALPASTVDTTAISITRTR